MDFMTNCYGMAILCTVLLGCHGFEPFEIPPGAVFSSSITGPPPANASALVGTNVSISCVVSGQQEEWEMLQWRRIGPGAAYVISNNNATLRNASKYVISGRYTLNIVDVRADDQGEYSCAMNIQDHRVQLTASVPPRETRLFWPNYAPSVSLGRPANLTCQSRGSRPEPTFRWYRGAVDITDQAVIFQPVYNSTGYADADTTLEITAERRDEGTLYKCEMNLPGAEKYRTLDMRLVISGGATLTSSILTVTAMTIAALLRVL